MSTPSKDPKNKNKEEKKQYQNKFLVAEQKRIEKAEKEKSEKHLFPQKVFYDENKRQVKIFDLPYAQIDMIFNSKNLWANFQNPDPKYIFYNLHREKQWRPLIFKEKEVVKNKNKDGNEKSKNSSHEDESSSRRKFLKF